MINQQGTLNKDSSETTCVEILNFKKKIYSKSFLNWFIGFCEGHENIFIVNRRYARFEICCSIKNSGIILYIKKNLKFGHIRKLRFLDMIIIEFFVQDNVNDLLNLINIFNGNLRCFLKKKYFLILYTKLKVKLKNLNLIHLLPNYIDLKKK